MSTLRQVGARKTRIEAISRILREAWDKAEPDDPVTLHPTSYQATFDDMARAVVDALDLSTLAELIEADREYDAVKAEHDACAKYDEHGAYVPREMYERMEAVSARRAAALARIGSVP